jgi:hypothetical protein
MWGEPQVLLDPRNHSIDFWRERRPEVLLAAQAMSPRTRTTLAQRRQLLGIGFTPCVAGLDILGHDKIL